MKLAAQLLFQQHTSVAHFVAIEAAEERVAEQRNVELAGFGDDLGRVDPVGDAVPSGWPKVGNDLDALATSLAVTLETLARDPGTLPADVAPPHPLADEALRLLTVEPATS